jgi:hypothetical protein
MAVALTIAAVSKSYVKGSLTISETANGRTTARFDVRSNDGTYRPAFDATAIITEDGDRIFAGLIDRPSEKGTLGDKQGDHEAFKTSVSCVDFNAYTERRFVSEDIAAGQTLKQVLTTLVTNYLTGYGVSLLGGQVNGPTLPALKWTYKRLDEVLNELSALTEKYGERYIWNIDFFKVLSAVQPSTNAAPFDVADGDGLVIGDITVDRTRDRYANRVIVRVPPKQESGRIESFDGDGSTDTFELNYTLESFPYGVIHRFESDGVTPSGAETFGTVGTTPVQWEYDPDTNEITRTAGATESGYVYKLTFNGIKEASAIAEDAGEIAAYGIWERVVVVEEVPDDTTVDALADAYLEESLSAPKRLKYRTFETGVQPGQSQHITRAMRTLDDDVLITDVVTRDYGTNRLVRDVSATTGSSLKSRWRDLVKAWSGDKTGKGAMNTPAIGLAGPVPGGGAAPPLTSVQFNRSGAFGGVADFTFDEDTNSLVCGSDSSITAADPSHCAIFGEFCEIGDA